MCDLNDYLDGQDDALYGRLNQRRSNLYDLGFAEGLAQLYTHTQEEEEKVNTNQKE